MAGLYLHIPFCKKACHYCNFHFSTSLKQKEELLLALERELELQSDYLEGATLDSIYLGGGTPSVLSADELKKLFAKIQAIHPVAENAEITLEANPDDLSLDYLRALKNTPINRFSIGVQSFHDKDLLLMNRAHDSRESMACIENALTVGFDVMSIDLIYGIPGLSDEEWEENLNRFFAFGIPHLSSYCLTVEPQTALAHFVEKGKIPPVDEDQAARQFEQLIKVAKEQGFHHYEISNFAKPGYEAVHNANYWRSVPYLGVGPSAHSFNQVSRQWNIANNANYIRSINTGKIPFEKEMLTPAQRYNEYVMTSLRTSWGCEVKKIKEIDPAFVTHFENLAQPFLYNHQLLFSDNTYYLSEAAKFLADGIASDLFIEEELTD